MSDAQAYRLMDASRVVEALPIGSARPRNESVARPLVPLLKHPELLLEAWDAALALAAPARRPPTR